jgi:hypothetical protein
MTIQYTVLEIGNIIKTGLKYAVSAQLIDSTYATGQKEKETRIPSLENFVIRNVSHVGTKLVHGPYELVD